MYAGQYCGSDEEEEEEEEEEGEEGEEEEEGAGACSFLKAGLGLVSDTFPSDV
jgi:hypothetical protein